MLSDLECKNIPSGPPDRTFLDGSEYWVVDLPSVRIGLGHFRPGWVWSRHAGAQTGQQSRSHIGIIQSGKMAVVTADGSKIELGPGGVFEVAPDHDAWVVGSETCVALDVTYRPQASLAAISRGR